MEEKADNMGKGAALFLIMTAAVLWEVWPWDTEVKNFVIDNRWSIRPDTIEFESVDSYILTPDDFWPYTDAIIQLHPDSSYTIFMMNREAALIRVSHEVESDIKYNRRHGKDTERDMKIIKRLTNLSKWGI